jgi:hypothetical protein
MITFKFRIKVDNLNVKVNKLEQSNKLKKRKGLCYKKILVNIYVSPRNSADKLKSSDKITPTAKK